MNTAIVSPQESPEARAVALAASEIHAQAMAFRVTDQASADAAGQSLRLVKDRRKTIDETRKAMTRPIDAAKAAVMDFFRPPLELLDGAERHLKSEVVGFQQREAEAARKRAEEERRKTEEAEHQAREAEEKAVELATTGGDLGAITAELERAETLKHAASVSSVSSIVAQTTRTRSAGVTMRSKWTARVDDFAALVKAAAERPELLAYLLPNETALRKAAEHAKAASDIPGVSFVEEKVAAVR